MNVEDLVPFILAVLVLLCVRVVVAEIRYYRRRSRWLREQGRDTK